jgi:hypothetical protein
MLNTPRFNVIKGSKGNIRIISISLALIGLAGCVGPSTPFGSIGSMKSPPQMVKDANTKVTMNETPEEREPSAISILLPTKTPSIKFYPDRQILHGYKDWSVSVTDVETKNFAERIKIIFNNQDVTQRFLALSKIETTDDKLNITFPKLRLPYDRYNQIEVQYQSSESHRIKKQYLPPVCSMYDQGHIKNTGRFKVSENILSKIHEQANKYSLNPRMMAGIIGQESSFNPEAVSWAKAIGLTQVTPLAETEIVGDKMHFPRYPALNEKPVWKIKSLIQTGKVNAENEWRLDPMQSIEGGIAYLEYVDEYWRKESNAEVLATLRGDPYILYTQVVLASYNSGPYRVKKAIERMKDRWILHSELKEAHKYVNRIFSFCHHFGNKAEEVADDSST